MLRPASHVHRQVWASYGMHGGTCAYSGKDILVWAFDHYNGFTIADFGGGGDRCDTIGLADIDRALVWYLYQPEGWTRYRSSYDRWDSPLGSLMLGSLDDDSKVVGPDIEQVTIDGTSGLWLVSCCSRAHDITAADVRSGLVSCCSRALLPPLADVFPPALLERALCGAIALGWNPLGKKRPRW
jgi:hypothetical protein